MRISKELPFILIVLAFLGVLALGIRHEFFQPKKNKLVNGKIPNDYHLRIFHDFNCVDLYSSAEPNENFRVVCKIENEQVSPVLSDGIIQFGSLVVEVFIDGGTIMHKGNIDPKAKCRLMASLEGELHFMCLRQLQKLQGLTLYKAHRRIILKSNCLVHKVTKELNCNVAIPRNYEIIKMRFFPL